jgi:competence protein ComEC
MPGVLLLLLAAIGMSWSWRGACARRLLLFALIASTTGGWLLAVDEWREAREPTLRRWFDRTARANRPAAEEEVAPVGDVVSGVFEGVLRDDAAIRAGGVSISLAIDRVLEQAGRPMEDAGRATGANGSTGELGSGEGGAATRTVDPPTGKFETVRSPRPTRMVDVSGGVQLTVGGLLAARRVGSWRAGRRLRVTAQLRRPTRYLNPGVPDQEWVLAGRGTILVGSVKSGALVQLLARGTWTDEAAAAVRAWVRRAVSRSVGGWSGRSAAIVTAVLIGDRAGVTPDIERRLQEAGTYHVIAISGGNIALFTAGLLAAFRWSGRLGPGARLLVAGLLIAYASVVGHGSSVDRAVFTAALFLVAASADLEGRPINLLAVIAGSTVALQPLVVADPGWWLTCGATAAILAAWPMLPNSPPEHGMVRRAAALALGIVMTTLAVEAVLLPVGAAMFARVTFAGLLSNLIAIPVMSLVQIGGMVSAALTLADGRAASLVGWLPHAGVELLIRSAELAEWWPWLVWRMAPPAAGVVLVYYGGLIVAWAGGRGAMGRAIAARRITRAGAAVAAAAAIWIVVEPWTLLTSGGDGRLHVMFLDVGQGDAMFVRFPEGAAMVVDAGGAPGSSFDIGDRVIAPVLRRAGVRRLRVLVATHGDADHIGGAAALVREFRPQAVWEGIPVPRLAALAELRALANRLGVRWVRVSAGDAVTIDGVRVLALHPGIADWERQRVRNDDSVVLELTWRRVSIVLTGDIGQDVERLLLSNDAGSRARQPEPSPWIRAMKVPHHGSRSSSGAEFLTGLAPRVAVVSAGRHNRFGHPATAVVRRYQNAGIELFRTDLDGAVSLVSDGTRIEVATFTGRGLGLRGPESAIAEPRRP